MSDLTDNAGEEGAKSAQTSDPSSGQSSSDLIFIEETLEVHPEWREPLEERVRRSKPQNPVRFKRVVLQNWKIGDGTPPPQCSVPPGPQGAGSTAGAPDDRPSTVATDPEFLKFQALKKARREGGTAANATNAANENAKVAVAA